MHRGTRMTRRAGIHGATLVLQHVPDLVRYGSKPRREQERLAELLSALRTYEQAIGYPPHQVFICLLYTSPSPRD